MTEPKVLLRERLPEERRPVLGEDSAWRWIGWFGVTMSIAGLGDLVLAWYPAAFGDPGWEFTTVTQSFAGLPLVALGMFALLASGMARGVRWLTVAVAVLMGVLGIGIVAALALFLTDVPIGLQVSTGGARTGILKATAKTVGLGVMFGFAFLWAAGSALRVTLRRTEGKRA